MGFCLPDILADKYRNCQEKKINDVHLEINDAHREINDALPGSLKLVKMDKRVIFIGKDGTIYFKFLRVFLDG